MLGKCINIIKVDLTKQNNTIRCKIVLNDCIKKHVGATFTTQKLLFLKLTDKVNNYFWFQTYKERDI